MPALLLAVLASKSLPDLNASFGRVIDNGKMLKNFVQIIRSGAVGRKSLGTSPKKLVQKWLNGATEKELLAASIGSNPSLADVVKMMHPKPREAWREAFFAWLIGKPYAVDALPPIVRAFEAYKKDCSLVVPEVPFQMLTSLSLGQTEWTAIAKQGGWHMVRMNLNTFARHKVFDVPGMTQLIANKLRDPQAIAKAKVFPYQLMAAFTAAGGEVPKPVLDALQDAMEIAISNVPEIAGKVIICPDVSGSMHQSVSGNRGSASSKVRCIDVAALVSAAILRKNRDAEVLPFETQLVDVRLNSRDSVMTNAQKLAATPGGGTNCSAPMAHLNAKKIQADLVIYVSDNESWVDAKRTGESAMMQGWNTFKQRNPQAKLVCIDVVPNATTQAQERADVLNIGGFSDAVFKIIASFASGQLGSNHWVGEIEAIDL
ncbi:MAG: RNA-binding protein, partial [Burkholderiales bacterium]|nr:RNA-binding protein [Burkholderiales bacterium]